MTTPKKTGDWRDNIQTDMPEERVTWKMHTFPSALEMIKIAAFNRRMTVEDFIGRAALAVAVFDSEGETDWREATDKEYVMADLRRKGLPKRRLRGRNFGPWVIKGMDE